MPPDALTATDALPAAPPDARPLSPVDAGRFAEVFARVVDNVSGAVLGKRETVSLVLAAMLCEGHVLIEDAPGTGKTSLAKALAASVQGTHSRIQFTPDLLPSDVVGVTIYDQSNRTFEFHRGPVFASIVLADEINRASPKTQSALLEVMEETQVTVDGVAHHLERPFMVIATQNPIEQAGTYRLPEAQLDRFLVRTSLGFPDRESGLEILAQAAVRDRTLGLAPVVTAAEVVEMSAVANRVHTERSVLDYVLRLADATHVDSACALGVSMRGAMALVRCAKVWALAHSRAYVLPDDIRTLAEPVLAHRLVLDAEAEFAGVSARQIVARLLAEVPPPSGRPA